MNIKTKIAGVPCRIETDDLGLYNIFIEGEEIPKDLPEKEIRRRIHEGKILLPEWIVRGQGPKAHAIAVAENVIEVRRQGKQVSHHLDPEGRIMVIDTRVPFEELERLREDFERRRNKEEE